MNAMDPEVEELIRKIGDALGAAGIQPSKKVLLAMAILSLPAVMSTPEGQQIIRIAGDAAKGNSVTTGGTLNYDSTQAISDDTGIFWDCPECGMKARNFALLRQSRNIRDALTKTDATPQDGEILFCGLGRHLLTIDGCMVRYLAWGDAKGWHIDMVKEIMKEAGVS